MPDNPSQSERPASRTWALTILLIFLFLAGFGLRMVDLTDPPLDFHPARQMRAAIIARGMYAQDQASCPAILSWLNADQWEGVDSTVKDPSRRQTAVDMWHSMAIYEPQIFERLVASTYCLLGVEVLWVSRLYSALFWVLGGLPLFWLARRATSWQGGVLALAFYLFLPFGVIASRSFQPDPLMVSLTLWSAYSAYRWSESKSWSWVAWTGIFSGLAVLIKAPAAFQVGLMLLFTVLSTWNVNQAVRQPQVWVVALLSITIPAIFYLVLKEGGTSGYLEFWSASFSKMIFEPGFYVRWLVFLKQNVVELSLFFAGLVGAVLLHSRARAIAFGLWLGYAIYGLVLPYLISTHDYYSLPLIPAIALSLAPFASLVLKAVSRQPKAWQGFFYLLLVLMIAFPAWISRSALLGSDYRQEILGWQVMGRELPEDRPIIAIIHDYGHRLRYYGWVSVDLWPTTADQQLATLRDGNQTDIQAMFTELTEGYGYFLVTIPKELTSQSVLSNILYQDYRLLKKGDGYLLFELNSSP